ncbi:MULTISPECIES: SpoIIE family protein phosphatase [unclassified Streptomyces]|uniref:SpoIIE family protein phosphatase n=1 Tax=unclassified Streptomyces TaxID=2593676 RepID=UPI00382B28E3
MECRHRGGHDRPAGHDQRHARRHDRSGRGPRTALTPATPSRTSDDTLLMVTDALVESPDLDLEAGLTIQADAVQTAVSCGPGTEQIADRLIDIMLPVEHSDDITLLVVQRLAREPDEQPDESGADDSCPGRPFGFAR